MHFCRQCDDCCDMLLSPYGIEEPHEAHDPLGPCGCGFQPAPACVDCALGIKHTHHDYELVS